MFTFTEVVTDKILDEMCRELDTGATCSQYHIESEIPIDTYDFSDPEKYRLFFREFAAYADARWEWKTNVRWDFSAFPFRGSSDILRGVYRVLRTEGPYGSGLSDEGAALIEEKYRKALQKGSESLLIFCAVREDYRNEDLSSGFGVSDDIVGLERISPFFHRVAWDSLMVIINPNYKILYVIAITDTD